MGQRNLRIHFILARPRFLADSSRAVQAKSNNCPPPLLPPIMTRLSDYQASIRMMAAHHDSIEQSIKQWIEKSAKILANLTSVHQELMDVFHDVSEVAAVKLCEQFIGVENGTFSITDEIIPCISYDAAIRALDFSPNCTLSISVYYRSHLQLSIELAWRYVCQSLDSLSVNISMRSALMLLGTTKRRNDSLVDKNQFFRCRTFRQLYSLLREFGAFLDKTWNNNNVDRVQCGKRIRLDRKRLSPNLPLVEDFLKERRDNGNVQNTETLLGACWSNTANKKQSSLKRDRSNQSSNKDGSPIDHTAGGSDSCGADGCDHEAERSSESSSIDSCSPEQNTAPRLRGKPHDSAVEHHHKKETTKLGKPPSNNQSQIAIEEILSLEDLKSVLSTGHVNSKNELEMCEDDWMTFVNSRPVAAHIYVILARCVPEIILD